MSWWNAKYLFRRQLVLTNEFEDVLEGHCVTVPVDMLGYYDAGKTREDYADVEVIHSNGAATPTYTVLAREVDDEYVRFFLEGNLDEGDSNDEYFLYFGNWNLTNAPTRPTYAENLWTVTRRYDDYRIMYTRPGDHWVDGVASSKDAVASIITYGERIKLSSEVGLDKGIMEVSVDGGDWEEVDLFNVESSTTIVYTKYDLTEGQHLFQMRATGRKFPGSSSAEVNVQAVSYLTPIDSTVGSEEIYNVEWASVMSGAT